jgi:hypothetical protein
MGSCLVIAFDKLTVADAEQLRKKFRGAGFRYRVVKNQLAIKAFQTTLSLDMAPAFEGKCGLVFAKEEKAIAAAKARQRGLGGDGREEARPSSRRSRSPAASSSASRSSARRRDDRRHARSQHGPAPARQGDLRSDARPRGGAQRASPAAPRAASRPRWTRRARRS